METKLFIFCLSVNKGSRDKQSPSFETWIAEARKVTKLPDAEVILLEPEKWNAPEISSFNDAHLRNRIPFIEMRMQKALIRHGIPESEVAFLGENKMHIMSNPITQHLVFVVKYTSGFSRKRENNESQILVVKECVSCSNQTETLRRICPKCGGDSFFYSNIEIKHEADLIAEKATQHADRGALLFRDGQFKQAEVLFKRAIEINPYNDIAYYNLGFLLFSLGKSRTAIAPLEKAFELNPFDMDIKRTLQLAQAKSLAGTTMPDGAR